MPSPSRPHRPFRSWLVAGAAGLAALAVAAAMTAVPAVAQPHVTQLRFVSAEDHPDAVDVDVASQVSVLWSQATVNAADEVVVVTGQASADAAAATPFIGGVGGATVTLVDGRTVPGRPLMYAGSSLDGSVADEIRRIGARRAVVIGGEQAVTPDTVAALTGLGLDVTRLGGVNRDHTAALVVAHVLDVTGSRQLMLTESLGGSVLEPGAAGWAADAQAPIVQTNGRIWWQTAELVRSLVDRGALDQVLMVGTLPAAVVGDLASFGVTRDGSIPLIQVGDQGRPDLTAIHSSQSRGVTAPPARVVVVDSGQEGQWIDAAAAALHIAAFDAAVVVTNAGNPVEPHTVEYADGAGRIICGPSVWLTIVNDAVDESRCADTAGGTMPEMVMPQ